MNTIGLLFIAIGIYPLVMTITAELILRRKQKMAHKESGQRGEQSQEKVNRILSANKQRDLQRKIDAAQEAARQEKRRDQRGY